MEEGEQFSVGDILYVVDTDKVTTEIEATVPGRLIRQLVVASEEVSVGTILAIVAETDEHPSEADVDRFLSSLTSTDVSPQDEAEELGDGSDAIKTAPEATPRSAPTATRAMPAARRRADELGIELDFVSGTGQDGAITLDDVDRFWQRQSSESSKTPVVERRPLTGVGRAMAASVTRSWREVPQFDQLVVVDASNLIRQIETASQSASDDLKITVTTLAVRAIVAAVLEVPEANASFSEDALVLRRHVNVSMAIDTPRGLAVPVLPKAESLSIMGIASELGELTQRARAGELDLADYEGGTITLSNLGMYGIESGTPLVTASQSTIIFLGAIRDEVVFDDGNYRVRPVMRITCAFDHRVLDGATAARFTVTLKHELEQSL